MLYFDMGRDKLKRNLQFKPRCKTFAASSCDNEDVIHLLHEELEALYLMDSQELYQVDAALQMNVSRPTFARILKSARQKMTMMLISGATLEIEDDKDEYRVMLASMKEQVLELGKADAPFLYVYHIYQNKIHSKEVLENPVFVESKRPGQLLPLVCNEYKINFFVATSIGEGLRSALLSRGIYTSSKKKFVEKDLFTIM
jgi:predicted DNA-binding protein (UPF0251 family)/predicted Fe-Mo cluster-binding NifX family protein